MKPIDFEFFDSQNPHPTMVCAAFNGKKYWLLDKSGEAELKTDLTENKELVAYYAVAEARCLLALGFNPLDFKWVDLYVEFKMQQNCCNKFSYGQYVDKDGNMKFSEPPDFDEPKESTSNKKVPSNLINAVFKNTRQLISSKEKEEVRDIILSKNTQSIEQNKERIMEYCLQDTRYLPELYEAVQKQYYTAGLRNFEKDMLSRGEYAAATAMCEQTGMPINNALLNKIIEKTPLILEVSKANVNNFLNLFEAAHTPAPKSYKNGAVHTYKERPARENTKELNRFIGELNIADWPKTTSSKPVFRTDKETLSGYRYIPAIDAIYTHNKTESSLKWFNKENGDGFFEAYGDDHHVRPFFGIFGTQTGRNAAKAKTFPLAMSSWLRSIIQPLPGTYIVGADFSQQEVAVAAELSGDRNLRLAYDSGDVYLEFAKQACLIPSSATKKTHKVERDLCKSTVLGLQYGMGQKKLQHKLTYDSGSLVSLDKTMELIDAHKSVFSQYWSWVKDLSDAYDRGYPLLTNDGFVLWQDNPRKPSVRNFPVQGTSASITRCATVEAWKHTLTVMCQLHDALYIKTDNPERDVPRLQRVMRIATEKILGRNCIDIRIDVKIIGHNDTWIEEKGEAEWKKIHPHLSE